MPNRYHSLVIDLLS